MKNEIFLYRPPLILCLLSLCVPVQAQNNRMKVDEDLVTNSSVHEIKQRGISAVPKYYFGDYAVISGKAGWIKGKSRTRSRFFILYETSATESQSNQKISYVFTGHNRDTVHTNAFINTATRSVEHNRGNSSMSGILHHEENFAALFQSPSGDFEWEMSLTFTSGNNVNGNLDFTGTLTDGSFEIKIIPVKDRADGKRGLATRMGVIYGYEFVEDGRVVAAVQTTVFPKRYVWLRNDLSDEIKLAIACSVPSIMIMVLNQQSGM